MSNTGGSSKDVAQNSKEANVGAGETKEEAEMINKCTDILSKLESGFSSLMNATIGQFGQHLSGIFKDSLECSIYKELIVEAVSRFCTHTFCNHCYINWLEKSEDCPICRDGMYVGAKNPLIDEVVQLLVDISFTEDEKKERSINIQHRATSSPYTEDLSLMIKTKESLRLSPKLIQFSLADSCVSRRPAFLLGRSLGVTNSKIR